MEAYQRVSPRADIDRQYKISQFIFEPRPTVAAFVGEFFNHRDVPCLRNLGDHADFRAVQEYECKYINAGGYWCAFHQASIDLGQEALTKQKDAEAGRFDVWAIIAVWYSLRVMVLQKEFYRIEYTDPVHVKLLLPAIERWTEILAAGDLEVRMEKMDGHMMSQLMIFMILHMNDA